MACEQINAQPQRGWDSLIPYMQPACMGIPVDMLIHNIRLAAIEFSERTGVYTQQYLVDLQKDVTEYPIDVIDCYRFIALKKVCYNGQINYSSAFSPHCCSMAGNKFWYENESLNISFAPSYDDDEALRIEIVVALTQDSCFMPESMYQDWAEWIAAGAIQRVLEIPGQPFTDYDAARLYAMKFAKGKRDCKYRVERSRIRGPMKMIARRFV